MAEPQPNESWPRALSFYESHTGNQWQHIPRFRELVLSISRSPKTAGLTAFTSHETLIVSPYTRDWLEGRHVRLHPLSDGRVRIEKWPPQFERSAKETFTLSIGDARDQVLALVADL